MTIKEEEWKKEYLDIEKLEKIVNTSSADNIVSMSRNPSKNTPGLSGPLDNRPINAVNI